MIPRRAAFSLLELLLVIGLATIILTLTVPAFHHVMAGLNLTRAGIQVSDAISLARQHALSFNRSVEVVFLKIPEGGEAAWRGMQVREIRQTPTGTQAQAIGAIIRFPHGIVIRDDATFSPLLTANAAATRSVPPYGTIACTAFRIRPSGLPEPAVTASNHFLTLQNETAPGTPPANYYTVSVNPITGRATTYQP